MKKAKFKWWYCLIIGLLTIIDGLTMILTLGYFATGLSLKYSLYGAKRKIYRKSKCILPVVKCPTCKFNKGEYCNVGEHKFNGLQSAICFEGEEYEKATVS